MTNPAGQSVGSALDDAKLTPEHWKIWFLSAMGVFLDAFDLFIVAVALPLLERDLQPSLWQIGLIPAASPLGAIVGAVVAGPLADRIGRKKVFAADLVLFVVFAGLSGLAWDVYSLIIFRFLLGVGVGADYPLSSAYVSEFMPARVRGRMMVGAFSFQAIGSLVGATTGLLILMLTDSDGAWRFMLAAGIIPAIAVLLLRGSTPESARWSATHGEGDAAAATVAKLTGESVSAAPVETATLPFRALFGRQFLRRTVLATVPWFLMDIGLYGIGLFTPTILGVLGFGGHDGTSAVSYVTSDIRSTEGAMILDLFLVAGFLIALWLIDHWGRIPLQMMGFAGMAVGMLFAALGAWLPGGESNAIALIFLGFALFNLSVNMGPNATTFTLPTELFPTSIRASAHGLAAATGKMGAAVGIFAGPLLRDAWGLGAMMLVLAGASAIGFVITGVLGAGLETRGRALGVAGET